MRITRATKHTLDFWPSHGSVNLYSLTMRVAGETPDHDRLAELLVPWVLDRMGGFVDFHTKKDWPLLAAIAETVAEAMLAQYAADQKVASEPGDEVEAA